LRQSWSSCFSAENVAGPDCRAAIVIILLLG
jgi:hypothetical protein